MPPKKEARHDRGSAKHSSAGRERLSGMDTMLPRKGQFLITTRALPGFPSPGGVEQLEQSLRSNPEVEILDVLTSRAAGAMVEMTPQRIIVARMPEERAAQLAQQAGPQIIVERDSPLTYGHAAALAVSLETANQAVGFTAKFVVKGEEEEPLEGAQVALFGNLLPTVGVTGKGGEVELEVIGDSPATVRMIYVKPKADYWSRWIPQPEIDTEGQNVIALRPLTEALPDLGEGTFLGWGQRLMRLDQAPPAFRGKGTKVAIIDSGIAASHRNLKDRVKQGYDAVAKSPRGWEHDPVGHGTHCAGIIAGNAEDGGIRGFAPEAELIVCKIFPEGRCSNLVDALDLCMAQQVDVINLSVVSAEPSQILEQKLFLAKLMGIACIVAAGNSGGPVQYPASSAHVLTVGAIGKQGEFPPDSSHAQTVRPPLTMQGLFSAAFSCFGPQVGVCAPGVAVVSSVPEDGFAAWDGTSMAAAHVSGLAALVLAHHPEFQAQGPFSVRNSQRVDRLFQVIRQSAQPLDAGDPMRTGAGVPDVGRALSPQAASGLPAEVLTGLLQQISPWLATPYGSGLPQPAFGRPIGPRTAPFVAPTIWGTNGGWPGPGALSPGLNFLLAIQQLRSVMQSAGLL